MILSITDTIPIGQLRGRSAMRAAFSSMARRLRDRVLTDPTITAVIVMAGAPGAGKSTLARQLDRGDVAILDVVHARQGQRISIASRVRRAGKRAIVVHACTTLPVCLHRNRQRPMTVRVPDDKVRAAHGLLSRDPPLRDGVWDLALEADGRTPVERIAKPIDDMIRRGKSIQRRRRIASPAVRRLRATRVVASVVLAALGSLVFLFSVAVLFTPGAFLGAFFTALPIVSSVALRW